MFILLHINRVSHSRQVSRPLFSWGTQAFAKLPDTPDEIDSRLSEEQSRAECFTGLSENVRMRSLRFHALACAGLTVAVKITSLRFYRWSRNIRGEIRRSNT